MLQFLHCDPLVEGIDHLEFLLVDLFQRFLLLLEEVVKFTYPDISALEDGLQLVPFLLGKSSILPNGQDALGFPEALLEVGQFLEHLLRLSICEGSHWIGKDLLMSCSNLLKVKG